MCIEVKNGVKLVIYDTPLMLLNISGVLLVRCPEANHCAISMRAAMKSLPFWKLCNPSLNCRVFMETF